ncbi:TerC family protein [Actinomyces bowdenii]|uniref:TerC family protein n=1 Tax=Actinomyces bowdenii TaxID=131109 RepID=A0A853EHI6_9ACTO|nr:TerC family protein [Actinomyces bowdenii]MBF0695857.1 TerC family protein [Actinomyces bowdenii]MCR2052204.1 TerC family protein [Actinomyces bowdenii]MDO5064303.1 TerC family protein [Actinomyces bowdenii]NYS68030.1 TerC family protein [Actinomyces bowdenii]
MDVHALGWIALAAIILTMITIDIVGHVRTPHEPTMKEAAWWSVAYIAMAVVFGGIVWAIWGPVYGQEYFAGYITEKALSVDNLFVFVIMISAFRVPRKYQQEVLLAGIIIALVLRLVFILAGAALIENFSWVFYIFGAWLLWTAISQAREGVEEPSDHDQEYEPSRFVRFISRVVPITEGFVGGKLVHRHAGRTMITPMMLCIIAIGTADVMFAVDSIPAIYSLTREPYLVFAANAFSLLGLRQLYFLIDGLLDRLVYLHYGLAAILGFIGLKLINHALHENELSFINGGEHWDAVPEPSIGVSLGFIVVVILITVVASVIKSRADARAKEVSA